MKNVYQLAGLAVRQAGYIGHHQASACGMTRHAIDWKVETHEWIRVQKRLYRVKGISGDYRGLVNAAVGILPDATISHESAAEIHGIPGVAKGKAVVTVHAQTTHTFPDVAIHRSIDLFDDHRAEVESLPLTTPARTIVDLAAVMRLGSMARTLDESLASRLVTIDEVARVFGDVSRKGRVGCGNMRKLLDERIGRPNVSATRIEQIGADLFERGGLPSPEFQYPAPWNPNQRLDFAWPRCRVGCECDSRRWHTRNEDFQRDRERDNLGLLAGWRIFRFTWDDFVHRPETVLGQLRRALVA